MTKSDNQSDIAESDTVTADCIYFSRHWWKLHWNQLPTWLQLAKPLVEHTLHHLWKCGPENTKRGRGLKGGGACGGGKLKYFNIGNNKTQKKVKNKGKSKTLHRVFDFSVKSAGKLVWYNISAAERSSVSHTVHTLWGCLL